MSEFYVKVLGFYYLGLFFFQRLLKPKKKQKTTPIEQKAKEYKVSLEYYIMEFL